MSPIQFLVDSLLSEKMLDFTFPVTPFTQDCAKPNVVGSTLGENNCSLVRLHSSTLSNNCSSSDVSSHR